MYKKQLHPYWLIYIVLALSFPLSIGGSALICNIQAGNQWYEAVSIGYTVLHGLLVMPAMLMVGDWNNIGFWRKRSLTPKEQREYEINEELAKLR